MHDTPEITALLLTGLPAQRRAEFQTVYAALEAAIEEVSAAEKRLATARVTYDALAQRAAETGDVSARDTAAAASATRDAETHLVFARSVVAKLEERRVTADRALSEAHAESYRPVFAAGRDKRLDAAARIDAASRALSAARADFYDGTKLVRHAMNRGLRVSLPPGGPLSIPGYLPEECTSERAERLLWAREMPSSAEAASAMTETQSGGSESTDAPKSGKAA